MHWKLVTSNRTPFQPPWIVETLNTFSGRYALFFMKLF